MLDTESWLQFFWGERNWMFRVTSLTGNKYFPKKVPPVIIYWEKSTLQSLSTGKKYSPVIIYWEIMTPGSIFFTVKNYFFSSLVHFSSLELVHWNKLQAFHII